MVRPLTTVYHLLALFMGLVVWECQQKSMSILTFVATDNNPLFSINIASEIFTKKWHFSKYPLTKVAKHWGNFCKEFCIASIANANGWHYCSQKKITIDTWMPQFTNEAWNVVKIFFRFWHNLAAGRRRRQRRNDVVVIHWRRGRRDAAVRCNVVVFGRCFESRRQPEFLLRRSREARHDWTSVWNTKRCKLVWNDKTFLL